MYLLAFFVSWISGWILTHIENVAVRKLFSTTMGILIQAYMYGLGNYSVFTFRFYSLYSLHGQFLHLDVLFPESLLSIIPLLIVSTKLCSLWTRSFSQGLTSTKWFTTTASGERKSLRSSWWTSPSSVRSLLIIKMALCLKKDQIRS